MDVLAMTGPLGRCGLRLPSSVERMDNLPSLFARADYVTLHVPQLPATEGLINAETLQAFKPGSVLLNFARQPVVDTARPQGLPGKRTPGSFT